MIDLSRRNDAEYIIETGIAMNPKGVRDATVVNYNISYGAVSTEKALKNFLLRRVNDGLSIAAAFDNVPVSNTSAVAKDAMSAANLDTEAGAKAFEETFVGSLLYLLFPPDTPTVNGPCPAGFMQGATGTCVPIGGEATTWDTEKILIVFGAIVGGIILILLAVKFIK